MQINLKLSVDQIIIKNYYSFHKNIKQHISFQNW